MDKEKFLKSEAAFILISYIKDGAECDEDGSYVVADLYDVNHPDIPSLVTDEDKAFFLSLSHKDVTEIYINITGSYL